VILSNSKVQRIAPAKVNLALHVTGQRADGYHLLDTLVAFTNFGDHLDIAVSEWPKASVSGPFGPGLSMDSGNLVSRAEAMWRQAVGQTLPPVRIHLTKNLPIASGIGGGSADAAATLLGLSDLFDRPLPAKQLHTLAVQLGADVPMCLAGQSLRATGIGEAFEPVAMNSHAIVLVNPGVEVATPDVFAALKTKFNAALTPPPFNEEAEDWVTWLRDQRNDLQDPASQVAPEVAQCLIALAQQDGCLFHRMSGSGATCFGLFVDDDLAQAAAAKIVVQHPNWWAQAGRTI